MSFQGLYEDVDGDGWVTKLRGFSEDGLGGVSATSSHASRINVIERALGRRKQPLGLLASTLSAT